MYINSNSNNYIDYNLSQKVEKQEKNPNVENSKNITINQETKIEKIKRELEAGTYKIDIEETAGKMIDFLI